MYDVNKLKITTIKLYKNTTIINIINLFNNYNNYML